MRISTTTAIYRYRQDGSYVSIQDCIPVLYDAGFRDIDFNFCKMNQEPWELTKDDWKKWAHETREQMEKIGMTGKQSHTPFYNVLDLTFPNREYTEELVKRSIEASGILGVEAVVIHGGTDFGSSDMETIKRKNIEYFAPHLELAEKCGTSIAIENMFDIINKETGSKTRRYLSSTFELIDLVDTLKKSFDNVGICWDFGHANEASLNQVQALEQVGERLIALHVNDNYGILDDHLIPYLGTVDWEPIMQALKKINYKGSFALETHKYTAKMPDILIPEALKFSVVVCEHLLSLIK